jgi:hypothetical protein
MAYSDETRDRSGQGLDRRLVTTAAYRVGGLGNSYCTNPFWGTCAHRMACIGCDFNLPKTSAQGQALESKASVRRYLEEVPLTADERAIVEGGQEKIEGFIRKLADVTALDGHTTGE